MKACAPVPSDITRPNFPIGTRPSLETTYPFSRFVSVNSLIALGAYFTARMVQPSWTTCGTERFEVRVRPRWRDLKY
jgi:hypothetical protein